MANIISVTNSGCKELDLTVTNANILLETLLEPLSDTETSDEENVQVIYNSTITLDKIINNLSLNSVNNDKPPVINNALRYKSSILLRRRY